MKRKSAPSPDSAWAQLLFGSFDESDEPDVHLHRMIALAHVEEVRRLVEGGADLDSKNMFNESAREHANRLVVELSRLTSTKFDQVRDSRRSILEIIEAAGRKRKLAAEVQRQTCRSSKGPKRQL